MKISGNRLSILILVDRAVGGTGPHRNVVSTLNALALRQDILTTVLCDYYDQAEPFAKAGTIKFHLRFKPKSFIHIFANLRKIFSLIRQADVIYVPTGFVSALYGAIVGRLFRKKIILGPNVSKFPYRKRDSPGFFEVGLLTDIWMEASQKRRNFVLRHLPSKLHGKVTNILHAIDLNKFNPRLRDENFFESQGVRDHAIKILHVGRDNEPIKGVPVLLNAIKELNKKWMHAVDFIIVGKMQSATKDFCKDFKNVHFLGYLSGSALSAAFASADIMIVPSSWENCPFTVLESLASGLPVIAFNTGGIPELINHGETGFLVDGITAQGFHKANAADLLAGQISELLSTPLRIKEMGSTARHVAEMRFSEKRLGDDLAQLFFQVGSR